VTGLVAILFDPHHPCTLPILACMEMWRVSGANLAPGSPLSRSATEGPVCGLLWGPLGEDSHRVTGRPPVSSLPAMGSRASRQRMRR